MRTLLLLCTLLAAGLLVGCKDESKPQNAPADEVQKKREAIREAEGTAPGQ